MPMSVGETRLRKYLSAWNTYLHDEKVLEGDVHEDDLEDLLAVALAHSGVVLLGHFPNALRISFQNGKIQDGRYLARAEDTTWKVEKLKSDRPGGVKIVVAESVAGLTALVELLLQQLDVRSNRTKLSLVLLPPPPASDGGA